MRAWLFDASRRSLTLADLPAPRARPGAVVVRIEAAMILAYMREVLSGALGYAMPARPFTPGTNAVGTIVEVGAGVLHLRSGQRVSLHPHHRVDERVDDPAQILIGLTAMGGGHEVARLQEDWPNGVFAELAEWPAPLVTPIHALGAIPASRALVLAKLVVPYGGLLRGALAAGECLVVNGASGYYGSAAVLLGVALGAARVVALGRDRDALARTVAAAGPRAIAVPLSGDIAADVAAIRAAAGSAPDLAFDIVGRATSVDATLAALRSLRRGGRLVLMGSATVPLPIAMGEMLANDWTIAGQFMYAKDAPAALVRLGASGQLDLSAVRVREFPLERLEAAIEAAAQMRGLDLTALISTPLRP